jgi:chromosome segregation ATPase
MKHITLAILVAFAGSKAIASDYVEDKMKTLNQNSENSEKNLKQYEDNLKTVEKNIGEMDKVIVDLNSKEKTVQTTVRDAEKNSQKLDQQKEQITKLIKKEDDKITDENKQIEKLQAKIAEVQKNIDSRKTNIATYNQKSQELDQEKVKWAEQKNQVNQILKEIDGKRSVATQEKTKLVDKKKSYDDEVKKWRKASSESAALSKNLKKLKD